MASNMGPNWWDDPNLPEVLKQFAPGAANALGGAMQAAPGVAGQLAANAYPAIGGMYPAAGALGNQVRSLVSQPRGATAQAAPTAMQDYAPQYPSTPGYTAPTAAPAQQYAAPTQPYGAGGAGATPTIPGVTPPPVTGPADIDPLNLIENPRVGVLMALQKRGINPYGGNPVVNALLKRAGDIVNASTTSLAGQADPTQALIGALSSAVDRALSGQAVFGGGGGGIESLRGAQQRVGEAAAAGTSATLGDQVLASLLSNPTSAASILSDLLYGGQGQAFSAVGGRGLADIAGLFQQQQLNNPDPNAPGFLDQFVQKRRALPGATY